MRPIERARISSASHGEQNLPYSAWHAARRARRPAPWLSGGRPWRACPSRRRRSPTRRPRSARSRRTPPLHRRRAATRDLRMEPRAGRCTTAPPWRAIPGHRAGVLVRGGGRLVVRARARRVSARGARTIDGTEEEVVDLADRIGVVEVHHRGCGLRRVDCPPPQDASLQFAPIQDASHPSLAL